MAKSTVAVRFTGDVSHLQRSIGKVDSGMAKVGGGVAKWGKVAALGLAGAGAGAVVLGKSLVDAALESQKVTKQTGAVIESMGASAWTSSKQVAELSTQLSLKSGVDDEAIQTGENLLLTFGNVQNAIGDGPQIFDRATAAALDMSVAMGTDMSSAAMQVGKALNDPVNGLSKLARAGIQFTDEQKATIKALQEGGDMAGAQAVMLEELERQFGGSAEAQATGADKMKVAFGNLQEELGAKLLPVFEKVASWLAAELPGAIDVASRFFNEKLVPAFKAVATWAQENLVPVIQAVARWFTESLVPAVQQASDWFQIHLLPQIRAAAAWFRDELMPVIAAVAAWILTKLVPAIAKVVAWIIEKLVPVIEMAARFFRDKLVPAIQAIAGWITNTLVPAVKRIMEKLGEWATKAAEVARDIKSKFDTVVTFFRELPGRIGRVISGLVGAIKGPFVTAFEAIKRLWNNTVGGFGFSVPDWVPGVGGKSFEIPSMDAGGIVPGPRGAPRLILAHGGETVLPTHKRRFAPDLAPASSSSGTTVVNNWYVQGSILSDRDLIAAVNRATAKGIR